MAAKYYKCPVVGTGTKADPYRAKVADYGVRHVAIIPSAPSGRPAFSWTLVLVESTKDQSLLFGDSSIQEARGDEVRRLGRQLVENFSEEYLQIAGRIGDE